MRIKKFGCQSENAKLNVRAQRFGVTASGGAVVKDQSKLNERALRFGTNDVPSTPNSVATSEVLDKRAKRFGSDSAASAAAAAADVII